MIARTFFLFPCGAPSGILEVIKLLGSGCLITDITKGPILVNASSLMALPNLEDQDFLTQICPNLVFGGSFSEEYRETTFHIDPVKDLSSIFFLDKRIEKVTCPILSGDHEIMLEEGILRVYCTPKMVQVYSRLENFGLITIASKVDKAPCPLA